MGEWGSWGGGGKQVGVTAARVVGCGSRGLSDQGSRAMELVGDGNGDGDGDEDSDGEQVGTWPGWLEPATAGGGWAAWQHQAAMDATASLLLAHE